MMRAMEAPQAGGDCWVKSPADRSEWLCDIVVNTLTDQCTTPGPSPTTCFNLISTSFRLHCNPLGSSVLWINAMIMFIHWSGYLILNCSCGSPLVAHLSKPLEATLVRHGRLWVRSPDQTSTNACRYICKYVDCQQVLHQRWIWGSQKWEGMQEKHPGFENQGRCHQKSKTGISVAPWKGLMSFKKNFKQKK